MSYIVMSLLSQLILIEGMVTDTFNLPQDDRMKELFILITTSLNPKRVTGMWPVISDAIYFTE